MVEVFKIKELAGEKYLSVVDGERNESFRSSYDPSEAFSQAVTLCKKEHCSHIGIAEYSNSPCSEEDSGSYLVRLHHFRELQEVNGTLYIRLANPVSDARDKRCVNVIAVIKSPEGGTYTRKQQDLADSKIFNDRPWKRFKQLRLAELAYMTEAKTLEVLMQKDPGYCIKATTTKKRSRKQAAPSLDYAQNSKANEKFSAFTKQLDRFEGRLNALERRDSEWKARCEAAEEELQRLRAFASRLEQRTSARSPVGHLETATASLPPRLAGGPSISPAAMGAACSELLALSKSHLDLLANVSVSNKRVRRV